MCDKCLDLDNQIFRYRLLKERINDRKMEAAAMTIVADLEAQKIALHPIAKS